MTDPCYCYNKLPPNPPLLNLTTHAPNYLLLRSLQKNCTYRSLIHIPIYRPAISLVAGDHYFEWRIPANLAPVCTVTFFCTPAIHTTTPICFYHISDQFDRICCYILCCSPPDTLPLSIEEAILCIGVDTDTDISVFVDTLNDFLTDYYRPISPILPTSSLFL